MNKQPNLILTKYRLVEPEETLKRHSVHTKKLIKSTSLVTFVPLWLKTQKRSKEHEKKLINLISSVPTVHSLRPLWLKSAEKTRRKTY